MQASSGLTLRIKSPEGMFRLNVFPNTSVAEVRKEVSARLNVPANSVSLSDMSKTRVLSDNVSLAQVGVVNGDVMLASLSVASSNSSEASTSTTSVAKVEEDEVDQLLDKMDGWVKQQRDEKACFRHPPNGSCVHCMPVPPWRIAEIEPWKSEKIKHIPFTSWLRLRDTGRDKGMKLTEDVYTVKKADKNDPWPKGISMSVRVVRQEYRHVDHVVFESTKVLGSLIEAWRQTGSQRGGFLFGRYIPHKDIPLGITAVVEAVYEPPQTNSPQGLQLKEDAAEEARVIAQAKMLGLQMLGFVWTAIEVVKGKVIKSRDIDKTFLASGAEMLQAALFQTEHPSPCRHSASGKFGSKWISVIVTGTESGEIAPIVFQVSDQMAGMARDGVITTHPDPRLLRVVDNPNFFVPTVLYDDTNEYNRAVMLQAKPDLPHIPFWVDVNFAAPKQPNPMFPTILFPVENRPWEVASEAALGRQLEQKTLLDAFADFHFFLHLGKILDVETLELVAVGIARKDQNALKEADRRIRPLLPARTSKPAPAPTNSSNKPPSSGASSGKPPAASATAKKHPNEQEWVAQLVSMGFAESQARAALEKSKWTGVEAALGFLF